MGIKCYTFGYGNNSEGTNGCIAQIIGKPVVKCRKNSYKKGSWRGNSKKSEDYRYINNYDGGYSDDQVL
jgi:hypothetical protein